MLAATGNANRGMLVHFVNITKPRVLLFDALLRKFPDDQR